MSDDSYYWRVNELVANFFLAGLAFFVNYAPAPVVERVPVAERMENSRLESVVSETAVKKIELSDKVSEALSDEEIKKKFTEIIDCPFEKGFEFFKTSGWTIDDLKSVLGIAINGKKLFDGQDIGVLMNKQVPAKYVQEMAEVVGFKPEKNVISISDPSRKGIYCTNPGRHTIEIYRAHQLGLTAEDFNEFKDSEKPNALVVFPVTDHNGAFEYLRQFSVQNLNKHYDVKCVFAGDEQEVYAAISRVPNAELLIVNGHGSKESLRLGDKGYTVFTTKVDENGIETFVKDDDDEESLIDNSDYEFADHLGKLAPNAVVLLYSCSTAADSNNLAEFVTKLAIGRTVYASKTPFLENEIAVKSFYPLEIVIRDAENTFCGIRKYVRHNPACVIHMKTEVSSRTDVPCKNE